MARGSTMYHTRVQIFRANVLAIIVGTRVTEMTTILAKSPSPTYGMLLEMMMMMMIDGRRGVVIDYV
jgi:hypothetical protein